MKTKGIKRNLIYIRYKVCLHLIKFSCM